MSTEIYRRFRPQKFNEVIGQNEAVKMLSRMVKKGNVPHAILFSGPSGTGKTTLARILANKLECDPAEVFEINIADFRKIETIREIRKKMSLVPMNSKSRVWILDEIQNLRNESQNALLKILEDCPSQSYFFLATTEPEKLLKTVRNRCTEIRTTSLDEDSMTKLLRSTLDKLRSRVSVEVLDKIIELAEGSARKALVLLEQALQLDGEKEQLKVLTQPTAQTHAIDLARYLMSPNPQWRKASEIIRNISEDPEVIRRLVLAYCTSVAVNGGMPYKVMNIINHFSNNYYDCGKAGLVWSTYHCCASTKK